MPITSLLAQTTYKEHIQTFNTIFMKTSRFESKLNIFYFIKKDNSILDNCIFFYFLFYFLLWYQKKV